MNSQPGPHILVVEDDPTMQKALRTILARHGFRVETAESGVEALERFEFGRPEVILLDLGLPDMSGMEVIRQVRLRSTTPIVVLSAWGAERDKVAALDLGADDYVTKPFGVDELLARIRVSLRRAARPNADQDNVFRTGDLVVDLERRQVSGGESEVRLTPTEYNLLVAFVTHPNKVLTDRMLLQQVWGPEYGSEDHYLHVYVARLRKKIESDPQNPKYLTTEPGVGYRLIAEDD